MRLEAPFFPSRPCWEYCFRRFWALRIVPVTRAREKRQEDLENEWKKTNPEHQPSTSKSPGPSKRMLGTNEHAQYRNVIPKLMSKCVDTRAFPDCFPVWGWGHEFQPGLQNQGVHKSVWWGGMAGWENTIREGKQQSTLPWSEFI